VRFDQVIRKGAHALIRSSERLEEFDRWYASQRLARLSYADALAIFTGLWQHAKLLSDGFPGPWEPDIEADIELARVLNGITRH
jgi:hypothetical protein